MTSSYFAAAAKEESDFIREENRKAIAKFNIPPTFLGRKAPGRKPKFNEKKWAKWLVGILQRSYGVKLHKYQREFLVVALIKQANRPFSGKAKAGRLGGLATKKRHGLQ